MEYQLPWHKPLGHAAASLAATGSWVLPELLHGEETRVWLDQAYRGQSKVIRWAIRSSEGTSAVNTYL